MKKIPKMISTKDASYIKDMFNWHLIAAQKIEYYLEEVESNEMQKLFEILCDMHYKHCQTLVSILESEDAK